LIPCDIRTIERHVKAEIPFAAQAEVKQEKKEGRGGRTQPTSTGNPGGGTSIGVSMTYTQTVNQDRDDSIKDSSSR
jgi:hypothetical protein